MIKQIINNLSFVNRRKLIRFYYKFKTFGKTKDLNYLATIFKTDKWGKHFYTPHYFFHFQKFSQKKIKFLENEIQIIFKKYLTFIWLVKNIRVTWK